jgi:hypothetical protein
MININGSARRGVSTNPEANTVRGAGIACDSFFDGNGLSLAPARIASARRFCDKSVLSSTLSVSKRQHAEKIDEMPC